MSIFNHIYHEVLDSKKENNNNYNNNLNNNTLFNSNNILTINEKIDYSIFHDYNDNVIKVVISIYAYCFIFDNRFLDYFFKYIIKTFIQFFIKAPTRFIRNKFKPDMIFDRIEIIQKRDITMKQLKALKEAREMINNIL